MTQAATLAWGQGVQLGGGGQRVQADGHDEEHRPEQGGDVLARCGGAAKENRHEEVRQPAARDPAIDIGHAVEKDRERKGRGQLAEDMDRFGNRRSQHQEDRGVTRRARGHPEQGKAVDAHRQQQQRGQLHHNEGRAQGDQHRQRADGHVRARGIGNRQEAGVPARVPGIEPAARIAVAEEHVNESVICIAVSEGQKPAVKQRCRRQRHHQEANPLARVTRGGRAQL